MSEDYYEMKKRIVKADIKASDEKLIKRKKLGKMNEKKVSPIEAVTSNIHPVATNILSKS